MVLVPLSMLVAALAALEPLGRAPEVGAAVGTFEIVMPAFAQRVCTAEAIAVGVG